MAATLQDIVSHSIQTVFSTDWFASSILALLISVALSAIAWMLSSAFQSSELKGWAKKELSEFIVSALILVLAVPLLLTITSLTIAYATAVKPDLSYTSADPFSLAKDYLDKVENQLASVYAEVSGSIIALTLVSGFSLDLGLLAKGLIALGVTAVSGVGGVLAGTIGFFTKFGIVIKMGAPFGLILSFLSPLQSSMVVVLLAFFVQKEILLFVQAAALPVLLPVGVLLRAFPLTRRAGSTLIALSLILFIVYPLTLAFVGQMYDVTYDAVKRGVVVPESRVSPLPSLLISRDLPESGRYYLDYNQEFRWTAYHNITYSIWHDVPCDQVTQATWSSQVVNNNINPPPSTFQYWKVTKEELEEAVDPQTGLSGSRQVSICYKRFQTGIASSGDSFGFILSRENYPQIDYKKHYIALVAQLDEPNTQNIADSNIEFFSLYLGNPCSRSAPLLDWFLCKIGLIGDTQINDVAYSSIMVDSGIYGLKGLTETLGSAGAYTISSVGLTPLAAGYVFYDFTQSLPLILLPLVIVIFTFVIIILVSVSMFRSVSSTLGGETELIELGRLI